MRKKTIRKLEFLMIILIIGFIIYTCHCPVEARDHYTSDWQKMKFSCYCPESCPGTTTASGEKVREGIIAASKDHMGDCAMVYLMDGTFLGYYECLDTGGSRGIKNGYVIDVWTPNLSKAKELMAITRGECYVEWIKRPEG